MMILVVGFVIGALTAMTFIMLMGLPGPQGETYALGCVLALLLIGIAYATIDAYSAQIPERNIERPHRPATDSGPGCPRLPFLEDLIENSNGMLIVACA